MISDSKSEGGKHTVPAGVRRTVLSIKEVVGDHSDSDIYLTLKETNMDPNETVHKLLIQDPFHEVKTKRDKTRELQNMGYRSSTAAETTRNSDTGGRSVKFNMYYDRNVRRGGYNRNSFPGVSREFRVVRDNRVNRNENKDIRPMNSASTCETVTSNCHVESSTESSRSCDAPVGHQASQASDGLNDPRINAMSNNSVIGSSLDPVHVPSDSRPAAKVGAVKRDVGVVGAHRQSSGSSVKPTSSNISSLTSSPLEHDGTSSRETLPLSAVPSNRNGGRLHQVAGNLKARQSIKEWKPKLNQKPSDNGPGVILPLKVGSPPASSSEDMGTAQLQDKVPKADMSENQNVIIAAHIRVSETDRCRLTFGSFGSESGAYKNSGFQAIEGKEERSSEPSDSLTDSAPESQSNEHTRNEQKDLIDDKVQNSGSGPPALETASGDHVTDMKEFSSPQDLDNYAVIGMVQDNIPSYNPSEPQQQQDASDLPAFTAYDSRNGYDITYFRPAADETVQGQGVASYREAPSLHAANINPASTLSMPQYQPAAPMYQQLHVSPYSNIMPYRQLLSPVYVPPMAMPGYSSNASYGHPSSGSSYMLMPGGGSQLSANGLKFGIQQFKPVPAGSPSGFGHTSPTGYAMNAPGVVGSATGLDDSSRLKYRDSSFFFPNPQTETSEIWMNQRDLQSMQSAPYYNMTGQTQHAALLPSPSGHASFNATAVAQSSHMQFPGLYHPPQPAAVANAHHLPPAIGGSVGVGMAAVAPGAQVGGYQQTQMGHLNWAGNF